MEDRTARPAPRPCVLLAVVGQSPAIVTETVWQLAQGPAPMRPTAVHLVTTSEGEAFSRAQLLGEPQTLADGRPVLHVGPHWQRLAETLGFPLPEPTFHVATREDGTPLADLRTGQDAARLADLLYRLIDSLTQDDDLPLVASIAGGRKTMSADLQTAFSVHARPQDRLVHVLVEPPALERGGFFFPTPETPEARLALVEIRVPRLRRVIDGSLLDGFPVGRRDLSHLLERLEPINYTTPPTRARFRLWAGQRGGCRIDVFSEHGVLVGQTRLSEGEAATLLALAEALGEHGGTVPASHFCHNPPGEPPGPLAEATQKRRSLLMHIEPSRWVEPREVSTALNRLNTSLAKLPIAQALLRITGRRPSTLGGPVTYTWARTEKQQPAPEIELEVTAGSDLARRQIAEAFRHVRVVEA